MNIFKQKFIILSILNLGLSSLIIQVILLRELLNSFFSNELFIGFVFFLWLLGTGLGSLYFSKFFKNNNKTLIIFHLIIPIFLIFSFLISSLSHFLKTSPGISPSLSFSTVFGLLIILPTSLLLGVLFVLLARHNKQVNKTYIIESIGFFVGSIFFSFLLFKLPTFTVIVILSSLYFLLAFLLSFTFEYSKKIKIALFLLFILVLSGLLMSETWNKELKRKQFTGELIEIQNTKFGQVAVTKTEEQINFYLEGRLVAGSQNDYQNELITHLSMIKAPRANRVLIIGNGFSSLFEEIKKYNPADIVYPEPNIEFYKIVQHYRLNGDAGVVFSDPREYLKNNNEKFDVIIINYGSPETLAGNRFFTKEFFELLKSNLNKEGIVSMSVDVAPNYLIGAQNETLSVYYHTLKNVFSKVSVLPDNEVVFLASQKVLSNVDIIKRYEELNLDNEFFNKDMINWRFTNDRAEELTTRLDKSEIIINSDLKPLIYQKEIKTFLEKQGIYDFKFILISCFVLIFILLIFLFSSKNKNNKILFLSAIPEFGLMSLEIILILWFEVAHGYLYTQLSLIISLVLLGIAFGAYMFNKLIDKLEIIKLWRISYLIIFISFLLPLLILKSYNRSIVFYILSLIIGFAVGTKFPIINKIILKKESTSQGAVYGADLIGASIGALLASIVMLPVLGVEGCIIIISTLVLFSIIFIPKLPE